MLERKRHPRHSAATLGHWQYAQIVRAGSEPVECVIENISWGGARLRVNNATTFPDKFDLIVESYGLYQPCAVIWKNNGRIGVSFQEISEDSKPDINEQRTILGSPRVRELLTFKMPYAALKNRLQGIWRNLRRIPR